jgi:hypothetical protein
MRPWHVVAGMVVLAVTYLLSLAWLASQALR